MAIRKKSALEIAAQTGNGAALGEYMSKQNVGAVPQTTGATTPPPTAGETRTPPLPAAGATTPPPTGANPGATGNAYQKYLEMQARQERDRIMTSGDTRAINEYLRQENRQRAAAQMNPYQATLAAATAPTSTLGGRTEDGKYRLSDGRTFDTLQEAVDANAGGNGNTAGKPMTNGTGFLAKEGRTGKITYGLWGERVTDAEGKTHWLDPDHGYFKSSNGYIYDTNEATDYELARHGLYRTTLNGKTVAMPIPAQNAEGFARNMDKLRDAHIAQTGSDVLSPDELYGPDDDDPNAYVGVSGGTAPRGGLPADVGGVTNYAVEYANRTPTPSPNPTPAGNPSQPSNPAPSTPTVTPGGYQPTPSDTVNEQGGDETNQNIYQRYLDQWDYPDAPEWNGTDYERQRDELLANAMNPYEGSPYDQQRDDALAKYGEKWQGSEYQPRRDAALERAENMKWNYDPNTDPVWQALQKQYRREGDRATQEAMAQAAMRTGGLANSYAVTAASQAGDYYAAQLSDRLPQLYQDAYQRYLQEFQRQMGISDQYQGFDDREYARWADQQGKNLDLADRYNQYGQQDYNRYMDRVSQQLQGADRYNNYGGTEYQRYLDQLGQYNTDRNFSYGRYRDTVGDYRYDDETQYNRAWNEEARDYNRAYQAQRDAILDNRADREWAQELRAYADAQGWKQAEWDQYLREYGDQLSEKERQWAYQMARDAVSDARYADETAYNRGKYEDETAYQRAMYDREYADEQDQNAWERGYKQTAYNDEMQRTALNYLNTNGIVTGRYAEILGVPDGTTYEQYYSRYLGGGGNQYAFDDTEIDSGKKERTATPQYSPPPPGDYGGGEDEGEDEGNGNPPPERTDYVGTHKNGVKKTRGYDELAHYLAVQIRSGFSAEQIRNTVYQWAAQDRISDEEIPIILSELGLWNQSGPSASPYYEGKIGSYTK